MKKRKTNEQITAELLDKDENFRRLYKKVSELNGGRIPSSEEIGQRLEERIARGRRAGF
jgi:seryl-tRNA synthetase